MLYNPYIICYPSGLISAFASKIVSFIKSKNRNSRINGSWKIANHKRYKNKAPDSVLLYFDSLIYCNMGYIRMKIFPDSLKFYFIVNKNHKERIPDYLIISLFSEFMRFLRLSFKDQTQDMKLVSSEHILLSNPSPRSSGYDNFHSSAPVVPSIFLFLDCEPKGPQLANDIYQHIFSSKNVSPEIISRWKVGYVSYDYTKFYHEDRYTLNCQFYLDTEEFRSAGILRISFTNESLEIKFFPSPQRQDLGIRTSSSLLSYFMTYLCQYFPEAYQAFYIHFP